MVWTKTRTDKMSVLIWVQTICKRLSAVNKNCRLQGKSQPIACLVIFLNCYSFEKSHFCKKFFQECHQCQTILDPNQAQCFISSDLDPNCKGYQQKMLAGKELNINFCFISFIMNILQSISLRETYVPSQ